ncbi:PIG-L family deacetylase [Frondihabitans peucedani]|uniref:N-acetyl-1-D-myo-inositol-2-amino-2-deoxy-alpha-D-glucopyranoside deacetylase n=1 Tax=Frondihabitans peucedani TaxID=598626 RepID=A0ABP8E436_9MICO
MSSSETAQNDPSLSIPSDLERVLVVHAHPDDETIVTGATLATLVDRGAHVTVVTCTRGELGEVMPDDLASLRGDAAALGAHRETEIAEAMRQLGVTDHRFLGEQDARTAGLLPRPYRDSGMEWGPAGTPVPVSDLHPAAFCHAEFGEIVSDLAAVVADVRPDAIIGYDSDGGYGHPDHVRVNRAALRTARLAGLPYFAITGGSAHPEAPLADADVVVDGAPVFDRKVRALAAYRSQVRLLQTAGGPALEFPHGAVEPVTVVETFRLVPEPVADPASAPGLDELEISGRIVTSVLALLAGGLFGAIGTIAHQDTVGSFPLGIVLALAMTAALLVGLRWLFDSRLIALMAAIGLTAVVALLSLPHSGSVLIAGTPTGYAWIFGPVVAAVLVLAWPRMPRRAGDKMGASPRDAVAPDAKEQN